MNNIIPMAIAAVVMIIGLSMLNSITIETITPGKINQTVGTANATGYLSGTLTYTPLSSVTVYSNGSVETGNVTVTAASKTLVTNPNSANFNGATIKAAYQYDDPTYLSGGLSRTIIMYIVPLGLIAVFAIVAGIMG